MLVAVILVILTTNVFPSILCKELEDFGNTTATSADLTTLSDSDELSTESSLSDEVPTEGRNTTRSSEEEEEENGEDLSPVAEKLVRAVRPGSRCYSTGTEGACYTQQDCFLKGGHPSSACGPVLKCCTFVHSCGDVSNEKVSYFRSPGYPSKSSGSLACDFDVSILSHTCAVRVDYENVNLARKLGGVCDIDQIFILNSVDGPTSGQCGPLSGYSTTVAVNPGQSKPVKLAVLAQNEATFHWNIKVTQLACNQVKHFRYPSHCGEVRNDIMVTSASNHITPGDLLSMFPWFETPRWSRKDKQEPVWWNYPEPIFNTFYYGSTKRHLQQEVEKSRHKYSERRIVSGVDASLGEFPWVAAIGLDNMFFCGGALINERFVLTAAHCLMARDTPIGSLIVHLGDLDLTRPNETIHAVRGVRKVLFHSHFHPFLLANDIALIQLNEPVPFTDTIQPVCLPSPSDSFTGRRASVVGWGVTSFPMGEPSPILQKLEVETLSNFQCSRIIEEPVTLGMICAAPTALQGTCFGDSGGPLTVETPSGRHALIGVVSFGVTGCAVMPAFPDLYTRVSEYIKWIEVNAI